jgi:cyclic pyranopterin phosphate synthase
MQRLSDGFGRQFHYLRLSVTEVCNFRCTYCLPDGFKKTGPLDFLSAAEAERLVAAFAELGLNKVRLTGGEPSARKDLTAIIARVAAVPGVEKVAMTTNGWNLARQAREWRDAGLTHLNVSIDSLDPDLFARLTGHERLDEILEGVDKALALGFQAVKVNAVLMCDTADGFSAFADYVRERPIAVRFIELMRTGDNAALFREQHLSGLVLKDWLAEQGWRPQARGFDDGPAVEYRLDGHLGRMGVIAPYAPGFCDSCNRLRVTARGKLRLCLFGDGGIDLRDLLQSDDDREALIARVVSSLGAKTAGHRLHENDPGATRHLAQVGG